MDFQRPPTLRDLGDYLQTTSQLRWLSPEEIYLLLSFSPKDFGIPSLQYPPSIIKGLQCFRLKNSVFLFVYCKLVINVDGTLCLYEDGSFCKQDNINWAK